MEVFHPVSIDWLIDSYSDIVQYAYCYFDIEYTKLMKLWSKLLITGKNNEHCTPFSNATLERFFSHLKVVKTQLRSKLLAKSLNSIMRIRMKGFSLEEFNQDYASKCADFWYNSKACCLNKCKWKKYTEPKSSKRKSVQFNVNELTSESSSCSSEEEC